MPHLERIQSGTRPSFAMDQKLDLTAAVLVYGDLFFGQGNITSRMSLKPKNSALLRPNKRTDSQAVDQLDVLLSSAALVIARPIGSFAGTIAGVLPPQLKALGIDEVGAKLDWDVLHAALLPTNTAAQHAYAAIRKKYRVLQTRSGANKILTMSTCTALNRIGVHEPEHLFWHHLQPKRPDHAVQHISTHPFFEKVFAILLLAVEDVISQYVNMGDNAPEVRKIIVQPSMVPEYGEVLYRAMVETADEVDGRTPITLGIDLNHPDNQPPHFRGSFRVTIWDDTLKEWHRQVTFPLIKQKQQQVRFRDFLSQPAHFSCSLLVLVNSVPRKSPTAPLPLP